MLNKIFVIQFYLLIFLLFIFPSLVFAIDTSRPEPNSIPTDVLIKLYIIDINEIDAAKQLFTANIAFTAQWKDQRLVSNNKKTTYDLEDVWNPNLQFVNRQKIFKSFPDIVNVDQEGTVVYGQRIVGTFFQPLKLQKFPFDKQKIEFQMVAAGNSPNEVNFVKGSTGISSNLSIPNWDIKGLNLKKLQYQFLPDSPATEGILLTITAERHPQFYIYRFMVPLLLIIFMSWIVFWIDPTDYTTQLSISITSMLTLIAYQFLALSSLPEVPYLTRMDILMLLSIVLVFASLIEATITAILAKRGDVLLARSVDKYCRYTFPAIFVFIVIQALTSP